MVALDHDGLRVAVRTTAAILSAVAYAGLSSSSPNTSGSIIAASGVVRWAKRKGVAAGSWLGRMLARKPPMLVIVALANKNARIAWAPLTRGSIYRAPAVLA
jgi:transposase